ncbi:MAG: TrpR-related protein YerC/YecD [Lachnospiraceae bacterium]|nr:TrpR-related protein YerC/YecD [Lachnospiraceae bacterium]
MDAIINLKNRKDCYDFFEDVCTIKEILDMSKRLEAAKLLNAGKAYNEIIAEIGISTATLSRVSRALNYGSGGYKKIINKKGV